MLETQNDLTDLTPSHIEKAIVENLHLNLGRLPKTATLNDWYLAVAIFIRDLIVGKWMKTVEAYIHNKSRSVCYFSSEFLIGPQLENNIVNLGLEAKVKKALENLKLDYSTIIDQEVEPGLGNGGLGRLAACFLDSLASLNILGVGYGIRYEYGIFKQAIKDGWQVELADHWLRLGNPWEIVHPEIAFQSSLVDVSSIPLGCPSKRFEVWLVIRLSRGINPILSICSGYGKRKRLRHLIFRHSTRGIIGKL